MVLGVDWMKHVSPICFNFNIMEVTFEKESRKMTLTGSKEARICKMITGRRLQKIIQHKMNQVAQFFSIQAMDQKEEELESEGEFILTVSSLPQPNIEVHHSDLLNILLTEFGDLFVGPNSQPPTRPLDNTINLKPSIDPVIARAYRYPPNQKTEREKLVKEMLQKSLIRPSHSPFASPVLLVKKKDSSWRFCVDGAN